MGKKIVLLSDGTGNSSAQIWRTNVWRVFESLDLSGPDQVAFYDDGVGTAAFLPLALLGGGFGFGLRRNVIDIYKFACRNYHNDDDEIYGFGFSRGAFTIRVVIGLIFDQGLVRANTEAELHTKASAAYRAYRRRHFHTKWPRWCRPAEWYRWCRNLFIKNQQSDADTCKDDLTIRFLGLWDTVAAYGMPVEEMARGISQWIWPWMLPSCDLHPHVLRACHALSIDDERTTFQPVLWDESKETPLLPNNNGKRLLENERVSQVWFAGVHANVGGGYPDDSLAHIPLVWIMSEGQKCGLRFKSIPDANPQTLGHPITVQDRDGRTYDPRSGLGGYYRYGPRDIAVLGNALLSRRGAPPVPRIHESVFIRIGDGAYAYAPLGLPAVYEIVGANGEVFTLQQKPYETPAQALARWQLQQSAWNTIWWRRIFYFLTVFVSLVLFSFPLVKAAPTEDEYTTPLRAVSESVRVVGRFLPNAATPWLDGYAREPGTFIAIAAVLTVMLWWNSWLAARIQKGMERLWLGWATSNPTAPGLPKDPLYRLRTSPHYLCFHKTLKTIVAPAFFAALFFYLGLTFAGHALFGLSDAFGFVCKDIQQPKKVTLTADDFVVVGAEGLTTLSGLQSIIDNAKKKDSNIPDGDRSNVFKILADKGIKLPEFDPSKFCQNMGVTLQQYGKYNIKFDDASNFADWNGVPAPYGYYSFGVISRHTKSVTSATPVAGESNDKIADSDQSTGMSIGQMLGAMALVPLRREWTLPWYRIVARIGGEGGQEQSYEPDFTDQYVFDDDITAKRDGQLFLFVNDAVLPYWSDVFYKNNKYRSKPIKVLITGK